MNRLTHETSPYLLQHSHNPVHWYPWGEEALNAAALQGKPILLSIGYSACHWCHVMERESFTHTPTAEKMNTGFINIKVDREERPDIDNIYMQAVQAITGRGGWPMTVFLLPDGRPFFGGTYFPREAMGGLPSFSLVLDSVSNAYKFRRRDVEQAAINISRALEVGHFNAAEGEERPGEKILHDSFLAVEKLFDPVNGGITGAPKFPNPMILEYLLNYHRLSGNGKALEMALFTLDRMARGGIHDQVGGGFHRYSVDDQWLVPHFEKMLYDNALLARLYLRAWLHSGNGGLKRTALSIYDYILREMESPDGGFYSATDADSEGEEGKFFTWSKDEMKDILGPGYELAAAWWGVDRGPNFEGASILHVPGNESEMSDRFGLALHELEGRIESARQKLYMAREKRQKPGLDDKILTSWSSMMTAGLAEAARYLKRKDYLEAAVRSGNFIIGKLSSWDGRLYHTYAKGTAKIGGFLDDYGHAIDAFIELYQATGDGKWLTWSYNYGDYALRNFRGDDGLFYDTGKKEEELFIRPRNLQDNAAPSGNSVMVRQLIRLWGYSGDGRYMNCAETVLAKLTGIIPKYPVFFGEALNGLLLSVTGLTEAVIIGDRDEPGTEEILSLVHGKYRPEMIMALLPAGAGDDHPAAMARFKEKAFGKTTLYLCRGTECSPPITESAEIMKKLEG